MKNYWTLLIIVLSVVWGGGLGWGTDKQTTYVGNSYVDNSYVRVKNITLGYSFSQKLLSKIGVDYLRLYINVLNPNYIDEKWKKV